MVIRQNFGQFPQGRRMGEEEGERLVNLSHIYGGWGVGVSVCVCVLNTHTHTQEYHDIHDIHDIHVSWPVSSSISCSRLSLLPHSPQKIALSFSAASQLHRPVSHFRALNIASISSTAFLVLGLSDSLSSPRNLLVESISPISLSLSTFGRVSGPFLTPIGPVQSPALHSAGGRSSDRSSSA